jgi:hypothetical protein
MENSPPGIHVIPSGASAGRGVLFSIVGRNGLDTGCASASPLERVDARAATIEHTTVKTTIHLRAAD